MKLLKSQTNELFKVIESSGFSPNQFEIFNEEEYDNRFEIAFKGTDYNFYLKESTNYRDRINVHFCPGQTSYESKYVIGTWAEVPILFFRWLEYLRREISAPDLWERFQAMITEVSYKNDYSDDRRFTAREYEELSLRLNLLGEKIAQSGLDVTAQKVIMNKLNDIESLAKDLNKYDWFNLLIGTLMSIMIQLHVTQDNANFVWSLVKQVFGNLSISE